MRLSALVFLASLALPLAARADTISTFVIENGTDTNGTLQGTLTIDVTTGQVTGGNFSLVSSTATYLFGTLETGTINTNHDTFFNFAQIGGPNGYQLSVPNLSLIGYTGSTLCSNAASCSGYGGGFLPNNTPGASANLSTGSLAQTPEPSGLILLGTGALAFAGAVRRRFLTA